MNKFIEIVEKDETVLINVNSISRVKKKDNGCYILFLEINKGDSASMFTTMNYEDLKKLIEN